MTSSRRRRTAVAALLIAGVVTSCSDAAPPSDDGSVATGNLPGAGVPDALQFRAPLVGGGQFDGAEFAGRPVVFWFWAPT